MAEKANERNRDLSLEGREPATTVRRSFKSSLPISRLSEEAYKFWTDGRYSKASPIVTKVEIADHGDHYNLDVTERVKLLGGIIQSDIKPKAELIKPTDTANGLEFNVFAHNVPLMKSFMSKFMLRKASSGGDGDFELCMNLWFSLTFYAQPSPLLKKLTVDGFNFSHAHCLETMAKHLEQLTE